MYNTFVIIHYLAYPSNPHPLLKKTKHLDNIMCMKLYFHQYLTNIISIVT